MFEKHKIKKQLDLINESGDQEEYLKVCRELTQYGENGVSLIVELIMNNHVDNDKLLDLLSSIYHQEYLGYYVYLLSSPNGHVRHASKTILSNNLEEIDSMELIEGLNGTPFYLRKNVTDLIIEKGDPKVVPQLIALYRHTEDEALKKNLHAIFRAFPCNELKDFLLKLTEKCTYSERMTIISLLDAYNDPKVIEFLEQLLYEKDTKLLRNVVESLGMLKVTKVANLLVPMLEHDDLLLRQKAMEALQKIVNRSIVPDLMRLFQSSNVNTRRAVMEVLNALRDEESITFLIKAFGDNDWWVREIATEALSNNKSNMIPPMLQKLLHVKSVTVRLCAVSFFTRIPGSFVVKDLILLLNDEDLEVRLKAVEALSLLKDVRAIPHILEKMDDIQMVYEIPLYLGRFENEIAYKAIGSMLTKSKNQELIMACLKVINKFKITELIPILEGMEKSAQFELRQQINNTIRFLTGNEIREWRG